MSRDWKYEVEIVSLEKPIRISKELKKSTKGIASRKLVGRMKKEGVDCPVKAQRVAFLECYNCPNFLRRYRGVAHCKGEPLQS